jgi:DNA/RNA-binding domain of Phe-tRNA-synthetase-like protein
MIPHIHLDLPPQANPRPHHDHPLDLRAVQIRLPRPISTYDPYLAQVRQGFRQDPGLGLTQDLSAESAKAPVRRLLRVGGHDPSGRGRPSSEHLQRAVAEGRFHEEQGVDALVDLANVASIHSGLPLSVFDLDRFAPGPLRVRLGQAEETYVFNPSGQSLRLKGLLCLCDGNGPTGSPVKDAFRTRTVAETRSVLVLVWGTHELPGYSSRVVRFISDFIADWGLGVEPIACTTDPG